MTGCIFCGEEGDAAIELGLPLYLYSILSGAFLSVPNFTGEAIIAAEQDFYAAIYLTNMVSLAKQDANGMIEQNESFYEDLGKSKIIIK